MSNLKILYKTPASLGYTFPAEWERHTCTWLSWPRPEGASFPGKYRTIPENFARIVAAIARFEPLRINVPNENVERIARASLKENGCSLANVSFVHIRTDEIWCRDYGPAFVVNRAKKKIALVDWRFNAWGGKYPAWQDDDRVPTQVAMQTGIPAIYPQKPGAKPWPKTGCLLERAMDRRETFVVMEGGAIDVNGAGTLITTTDCLLNKNRNPDLSKAQIEKALKDYYGQRQILWLSGEVEGDDTDGHVDDLARFISPTKLVMAVQADKKDVNYAALRRAREQAGKLRDPKGKPFEIIELPMPNPVVYKGIRLPATYVNFYFVNGGLIVPTYRDRRNDAKALAILQSHLPKHKVVGVDCTELVWGRGAIHCITQQQPAV